MPFNKSAIFAALLAPALLTGCLGEEKPKCVPKPTLKCVMDASIAALNDAGSFAEYDDMAVIARAQKKVGDTQGFERTLALAEVRYEELAKRAPLPESRKIFRDQLDGFYVNAGAIGLARTGLEQTITRARNSWSKPEERPVETLVAALIAADRPAEARAAVAEQWKWLEATAPTLQPDSLCEHAANLWRAYGLLGDRDQAAKLANICWARLREQPLAKADGLFGFSGKENVRDRLQAAGSLLEHSIASPADEMLADARKLLGPQPVPAPSLPEDASNRLLEFPRLLRLELALSRLKKDAAQEAAIVEAMRMLRVEGSPQSRAEHLRNDARALVDAGIRPLPAHLKEEAAALLDRLKAAGDTRNIYFKYIAEVYAMLGDEAATRAVFAAMKPEADRPWVIADDRRDICVALARNAHVEAALACATSLPGSKPYHKANTVAAYAAMLEAVAR